MKKLTAYLGLIGMLTIGAVAMPVVSYATEQEQSTQAAGDLVASDEEKAPAQEVGEDGMTPIYGSDVKDGTYEVEVESSSSMFKIVKAELTVENGEMSAVITLSGTGYLRLYMGTGEQAVAADASEYAEYVEDADGAYTYTIAVEALDQELECTGFSRRKEKWYDHQILFRADSLPSDALLVELATSTEETATDTESTTAEEGTIAVVEQQTLDLADGTYTMEVTLAGGSGKASITSPATVRVASGLATATIEWSSSNYDYMIVNGEQYLPTNTEGNSTFEIPLLCVDEPMSVIADTTAMSTPHEITYTLTFDSGTAAAVSTAAQESGIDLSLVFLLGIVFLTAAVFSLSATKKQ